MSGGPADWSFLAPPDRLADWRMVLAYEAAVRTGMIDALPGTAAEVASTCGLDEAAVRAVLVQLTVWELLTEAPGGSFRRGPRATTPLEADILAHHGVLIRRWAALLEPRLGERTATAPGFEGPLVDPATGQRMLEAAARPLTEPLVTACLERFPHARRVLDLAGGHGAHARGFADRGLEVALQDLPGMIELATQRAELSQTRIRLVGADLHHEVADGPFDLVLCGLTTNMFPAAENLRLLERIHDVLAPGGGLALLTYVRGAGPVAGAFGLQMLLATDAGDAHGTDDYAAWTAAAGFGPLEPCPLGDADPTLLLAPRDGAPGAGA